MAEELEKDKSYILFHPYPLKPTQHETDVWNCLTKEWKNTRELREELPHLAPASVLNMLCRLRAREKTEDRYNPKLRIKEWRRKDGAE